MIVPQMTSIHTEYSEQVVTNQDGLETTPSRGCYAMDKATPYNGIQATKQPHPSASSKIHPTTWKPPNQPDLALSCT